MRMQKSRTIKLLSIVMVIGISFLIWQFIMGKSSKDFIKNFFDHYRGFSLSSFLEARSVRNKYVFDYAELLEYSVENKEESLKFFKEKYGAEMIIVTVPNLEGRDIINVATQMFTNWKIGQNYNGKGILILLAEEEKQIKVEVGFEVEGTFTDLFCGYIERLQLKPYFENNQVDLGLSATIEEFIGRSEGRLIDEVINKKMEGYLSAGAGIKKDVKIGEFKTLKMAEPNLHIYYVPQKTPEELHEKVLESYQRCIQEAYLPMYNEETQIRFAYSPKYGRAMCNKMYQMFSNPYEILVNGDYAVLYHPGNNKVGPTFMHKGLDGWQLDVFSISKWVRYDSKNNWFLGGRNHPYAFAFYDSLLKDFVYDRDYYDDYKWFSPIKGGYKDTIEVYEKKLQEDPEDFQLIIQLAELFFDLKIAKKAVPLLKKAIVLQPDDPRAYLYLGLLNRDYFVSTKKAIDYLDKYIDLVPDDPNGYHYQAVCYWRMGSKNNSDAFKQAARRMEEFNEYSGNLIYGYKMTGYFYYKAKEYSKARISFDKILEIDTTHAYAHKMLRKIKDKKI